MGCNQAILISHAGISTIAGAGWVSYQRSSSGAMGLNVQEAMSFKEEIEAGKEASKCRICTSQEADAAMKACGHVLCVSCASSCRGSCPFCRVFSSAGFLRLYH